METARKKKKIRMIGTDLDGTLLKVNKELTACAREAVEKAIRAGIVVVPVTGRPLTGVPKEIFSIPGIRYCITSNGANTYDLAEYPGRESRVSREAGTCPETDDSKGREAGRFPEDGHLQPGPVLPGTAVMRKAHLPHDIVRTILDLSAGEDVIREIFLRGVGYHDPKTQKMLEERFTPFPPILAYIRRSRMIVEDLAQVLEKDSARVENISLMFPSQEARDAVYEVLADLKGEKGEDIINILVPWKTDLEITHIRADKWLALEDLGNRLGICPEEIMTIGDGDNDRPMLLGAGVSFAMDNAPHFVKITADRLTEDNEHDGAAKAILQILAEQQGVSLLK